MDWHRFDADPDPNFHVDVDPMRQKDADTQADPTLSFMLVGNLIFFQLFITALPVYNVYLSYQCQRFHYFKYFGQHFEILRKKFSVSTFLLVAFA